MSLSPLVVDDFLFQSLNLKGFKNNLNYALGYGNGRLLGNLGVLYFMKYPLLKVIIKSVAIIGVINLIRKVLFCENRDCDIQLSCLSFLLTIGVAPQIFAEVFTWTSGFSNYVPPIICMLLCLIIIKKENKPSKYEFFLIFVLGIVGQLYVEHSTIINVVMAVVCLFHSVRHCRDKISLNIVWVCGTIIGMIIMFLIPKLFCVFNEFEGYQKLNLHGVRELIISIVSNAMFISKMLCENCFLFIALSTLLIYFIKKKKKLNKVDKAAMIVLVFFPIFCILSYILKIAQNEIKINLIFLCCLIVYVMSVVYFILTVIQVKALQIKSMFFLLMAIFSILPLLIVYPIGKRCLFHSYIFLSLLVLSLFEKVYHLCNWKKIISNGLKVASVVLMFLLCVCFKNINNVDKMKHQHIQKQMQNHAQEIMIPDIKSDYVHTNENGMIGYRYYYKEKGDIIFVNVDYKTWRDK